MFAQFNYSSLSHVILDLSSAVTNLPNKTFTFHDFLGLENEILKFHDFPGFPWTVRTLIKHESLHADFESSLKKELSSNVALDSNFRKHD